MGKGRRYEENRQLNMRKVYGTIAVVIMVIIICIVTRFALNENSATEKITSQTYFSSFDENKWGVIDSKGNNVIEPSYMEMIIIPNEKEDVFLCTYDVDYETGTYETKVVDAENKEIYKGYDKVEAIQNKDINNNLWYESDVLRVQKEGKYGLISLTTGISVLNCEYDSIEALLGTENAFVITKEGNVGIINNRGKEIVEPIYSEIENIGSDNKDGYIVKLDGKYGLVDYSNKLVLETIYDEIKSIYSTEYYVVVIDGIEKVINKDGEVVLEEGFDSIVGILKSETGAIIAKDGDYGVVNFEGEELIAATYTYLEETVSEVFIANKEGKYGVINKDEELMLGYDYQHIRYSELANIYIADYDDINSKIYNGEYEQKEEGVFLKIDETVGYFQIKQGDEIKYYNFKFEEKQASDFNLSATLFMVKENGKYGFVDSKDEVKVECIYDDAKEQNSYGFVAVKKDGKWGSIDLSGNIVVEPIYDLDDYLIVDFIGKWHLGKDLNMNLYNQLDK